MSLTRCNGARTRADALREQTLPTLSKPASEKGPPGTTPPAVPDELDADQLAEVALGLLSLTIHDENRAWKGLDWGVMDLLHERGWIRDPRGAAKSVVLTETGLAAAQTMLLKHCGRTP